MKISIALAAYNGHAYLPDQLDSFVAQTRQPDELVVVDDGSYDRTPDIVRAFAERAQFPVRLVVNVDNLGHGQNFGKALSLCSGDLVFLSDQDDLWFDEKIEKMANLASNNNGAQCFMNDALLTDGALVPSGVTKQGQIRCAGLPETTFVMGCCVVVKRDLLDIALPIPKSLHAHDNWLVGISDHLGLTRRSEEILQYYRRHGANQSNLVVNRPERLNKLQIYSERLRQLKRKLRTGGSLDMEYSFHLALTERIDEKRDAFIRLVGTQEIDELAHVVSVRLETLSARRNIRGMEFKRRPLAIVTLLAKNGYRSSGGLLGAVKDLVVDLS